MESASELLSFSDQASEQHAEALVHLLRQPTFRRQDSELAWFDFEIGHNGGLVVENPSLVEEVQKEYSNRDRDGYAVRMELSSLSALSPMSSRWGGQYAISGLLADMDVPQYLPRVETIDGSTARPIKRLWRFLPQRRKPHNQTCRAAEPREPRSGQATKVSGDQPVRSQSTRRRKRHNTHPIHPR